MVPAWVAALSNAAHALCFWARGQLGHVRRPVAEATRGPITTLEGLGTPEELHPIQQAFLDEQAAQCGYCTSGMIMVVAQLLGKNHHPTNAQIRSALDENLCRCGSHPRILRAAHRAAELMWGEVK